MAGLVALRFVGAGVGLAGRSLYVLPLEGALGVRRASISSIFTASQLAIGLTGPLAGWLTDRLGPRKIMFICVLVTGAGFFALAAATSLWQLVLIFAIPLGLTFNWAVTQPPTAITNNWFEQLKATSLSLLNVGTGSGGLLLPLLDLGITELGWRWAAFLSGVAFLVVALPVVALVRNTPEEMGLLPFGATARPASGQGGSAAHSVLALSGPSLGEALRTPIFWSLAFGCLALMFVHGTVSAHLIPMVVSTGGSATLGAQLLSVNMVLGIPIVLIAAQISDRLDGPRVLMAMAALTFLGAWVLLQADHRSSYWLAIVLLAPAGTPMWAILWATLGREYGRRHFNLIRGTIYGFLLAGASPGPVLAGLIFDRTGSYRMWLWAMAAISVLAIGVFFIAFHRQLSRRRATAATL
jgi:sugar phosphate permease